jgi:hypothetical protein
MGTLYQQTFNKRYPCVNEANSADLQFVGIWNINKIVIAYGAQGPNIRRTES